jgi:hypothetical protein
MSAIQTTHNTDSRKWMPMTRAWASANQASHSKPKPNAQRNRTGHSGQPAGPRLSTHAPPTTHSASATDQTGARPCCGPSRPVPAAHARPSSTPLATAGSAPAAPFKRAHSHPAALMATRVNRANGQGLRANKAGSISASSTKAVITR